MIDTLLTLIIGILIILILGYLFWPDTGFLARMRRMRRMTARVQKEDALKHIQKLELTGKHASIQSIAGALGLDVNRVATLVTELADTGLIEHAPDGIVLTQEGGQVAMNVIRAHRLWEHYLAEHTGFNQSEWHLQAEHFEHEFSSDELDELAGVMGNPLYDPHGDPIPSREGELFEHDAIPLTQLGLNQFGRILHVGDEPEMVAAQIEAEGLLPGMVLRVSEITPNRVRFWSGGEEHVLAPVVAATIKIQPLEENGISETTQDGAYLSDLTVGQKGKVVQLLPKLRGAERRRLLDLGMLPGTTIEAEISSPLGDPVAYRVRDSLIALREEQARNIKIELLVDEA